MAWLIKGLAWLVLGVLLALAAIWSWSAGLNPYWPVIFVVFAGFSLFRSYKAFVEVWRNRLSKRVKIEVAADKGTYLPGDAVNVTVRVMGKEELDIEEGRVALVCDPLRLPVYVDRLRRQPGLPDQRGYGRGRGGRRAHPGGENHPVGELLRARGRLRGTPHSRARGVRSRTSNGRSGSPSSSAGRRTSSRRYR